MIRGRRGAGPAIVLAFAAAVFGGAAWLVFSYAARRGESYAERSSHRATEDGLRALALLCEAQGIEVRRLEEPWDLPGLEGVLVVTDGASGFGRIDPADLAAWVADGNTALLLAESSYDLLSHWGVGLEPLDAAASYAEARPDAPYTRGAPRISIRTNRRLTRPPGRLSTVLYDADGPAAIRFTHGLGEVVAVSDAHPATNAGLAEAANAMFLLNVLERGAIFDETASRKLFGEPGFVRYARRIDAHWLIVEALLLFALAMWHLAPRVGPPATERAPEARPAADFVVGCARLYEKGRLGPASTRILTEALREEARGCTSLDAAGRKRLEGLLAEGGKLGRWTRMPDATLLGFARRVYEFRKEVLWKAKRFGRSATPAG